MPCLLVAVQEYEDELVSVLLPLLPSDPTHSMSYDKHAEAVEVFCQATVGICEERDRDFLGDWEGDGKTKLQTTDPNTNREPLQREVGDPLMDKHTQIPEGKTIQDLLPDDTPVFAHEDFTASKSKKSKQKAKAKKKRKKTKNE